MSVVPFRRPEPVDPHSEGPALCIECGHRWQAVAPIGAVNFECPACGTVKGVWVHACEPIDETHQWRCQCGGAFFNLYPTGAPMCARCGLRATGWAEG